jgi:hypothetical protein
MGLIERLKRGEPPRGLVVFWVGLTIVSGLTFFSGLGALTDPSQLGEYLIRMTGVLMIVLLLAAIYMLPSIVAWKRRHRNLLALTVGNVLLGWTVIAWVALLIWALLRQEAPHGRWTDEYWY